MDTNVVFILSFELIIWNLISRWLRDAWRRGPSLLNPSFHWNFRDSKAICSKFWTIIIDVLKFEQFRIISCLEYQFVFDLYSTCHLLKFESTRIDLLIFWICNRFSNIRDIWDIVMVLSWDFLWKKYFFKNHSKVEELSENYWHFRIISRLEYQFVFDLYSICQLLKFESTRHDLLIVWICRDSWDIVMVIKKISCEKYTFFKKHSKVEKLSDNCWQFENHFVPRVSVCICFVFDLSFTWIWIY